MTMINIILLLLLLLYNIIIGADINCKDANNFTPLHLSARSGHIESFKLLVERGGDIDKNQLAGYPIEYKKIIEQGDTYIYIIIIIN